MGWQIVEMKEKILIPKGFEKTERESDINIYAYGCEHVSAGFTRVFVPQLRNVLSLVLGPGGGRKGI